MRTSTFTIKKEIEHTIDVRIPSFWKGVGSKIIGILDTDSVFMIWNIGDYTAMNVQALGRGIAEDIQEMKEIPESEFFAEYNKAYEAFRLKPEIKSGDDYTESLAKVMTNQTY